VSVIVNEIEIKALPRARMHSLETDLDPPPLC
jgi:hypothetical protein